MAQGVVPVFFRGRRPLASKGGSLVFLDGAAGLRGAVFAMRHKDLL